MTDLHKELPAAQIHHTNTYDKSDIKWPVVCQIFHQCIGTLRYDDFGMIQQFKKRMVKPKENM